MDGWVDGLSLVGVAGQEDEEKDIIRIGFTATLEGRKGDRSTGGCGGDGESGESGGNSGGSVVVIVVIVVVIVAVAVVAVAVVVGGDPSPLRSVGEGGKRQPGEVR